MVSEKLKCFAILCLLIQTVQVEGQVLVGPVAGGQLDWIVYDDKSYKDEYSIKPSTSYHAGASISFRMAKNVFLQSSVLYTQKGKHITSKEDSLFSNKAKYNYIQMPITFTKEIKMRFGKGRFYNIYFGAGPTVNYWLGGRGKLKSSDLNENLINPPNYDLSYHVTFNNDVSDVAVGDMNVQHANRFQLGLNFSLGIVLQPDKINKVMLTTRYEIGHSYLSQEGSGDYGLSGILYFKDDLQSRFQSFAVSLFYFIDLKTEDRNKGKSTIKLK